MAISAQRRQTAVSNVRRHEKDTGSPEVQISLLTERINNLAEHMKSNQKDNHSKRGLVLMVGRRNRLLKYLASSDREGYVNLIGRLGLRK